MPLPGSLIFPKETMGDYVLAECGWPAACSPMKRGDSAEDLEEAHLLHSRTQLDLIHRNCLRHSARSFPCSLSEDDSPSQVFEFPNNAPDAPSLSRSGLLNLQQLSPSIWIPCVYFLKGLSTSEDTQFLFTSEEATHLHPGMHTHSCARILRVYPGIKINCLLGVSTCYLAIPLSPSPDFSDTRVFCGSSIQLWRLHTVQPKEAPSEKIQMSVCIMIVVCLYLQRCWTGFQRFLSDAHVIRCMWSTLSPCPDRRHHGWL